jgi:hypothetical protein
VPGEIVLDFGFDELVLSDVPVITSVTSIKGYPNRGTITFAGRHLDHYRRVYVWDGRPWCDGGGVFRVGKVIAASSTSITVTGAGWHPSYFGAVKIEKNVPWSVVPITVSYYFVAPPGAPQDTTPTPQPIPDPATQPPPGGVPCFTNGGPSEGCFPPVP